MEMKEIESAVEGILFASGEPVQTDRICVALEMDRPTVEQVLQKLMDYYAYERRGIRLLRMEDTWQLCSAPDYADVIRKAFEIRIVCRFFEPTEGRVLIDGRDARARSQLWLHSNIGYVLQTPHLFSGTVLENLRYGRPDATMDEIEAAVKAVSADQIIARLPDGYDSDIGEGGNTLSTGEKQLLSFARALLADPRIFVLDEATSSVDTVTEQLIQNAIVIPGEGRFSGGSG